MINPERILKNLTFKIANPLFKQKSKQVIKENWRSLKRVLVFRLDNKLGNAILMLPLIQSIKNSLPKVEIDVLYSSNYSQIFENHPAINSVIEYDQQYLLQNPARYIGFINKLRKNEYDVIFSSTNPNSFSVSQAMFARLLKPGFTIGFDWKQSAEIYSAVVNGNTKIHYAHAQVDLWRYFDENAKYENPKIYFTGSAENQSEKKEILFWIGATGRKILPKQLLEEILHFLQINKYSFQLAAGPHDEHLLENYPAIKKKDVVFLKGSIKDSAQYFKNYKIVFMPDTGPMHLAVAMGIPTVQVFFDSDPVWYAYKGEKIFLVDKKLDSDKLQNFIKKNS